ncbi:MAG: glutaredoxin family protein [Actinomycetota bacterium]
MATVKLFFTPGCPYCRMARDFLGDEGIAFEALDVSNDDGSAREMIEKSGQVGIPVLEVDNTIVVGFNRGAYKRALSDSGVLS